MTAGVLVAVFDALPLSSSTKWPRKQRYAALATGALALSSDPN